MQKIDGNPERKHKTVEDWLAAAVVTVFYLLIIALTFFSAYWAFQYMDLASWNK